MTHTMTEPQVNVMLEEARSLLSKLVAYVEAIELRPLFNLQKCAHLTRKQLKNVPGDVAGFFGISNEDIKSRKRPEHIAWPRHVCMALMCELSGETLKSIGAIMGRNYSTVHAAARHVADACEVCQETRLKVAELRRQLIAKYGLQQPPTT